MLNDKIECKKNAKKFYQMKKKIMRKIKKNFDKNNNKGEIKKITPIFS